MLYLLIDSTLDVIAPVFNPRHPSEAFLVQWFKVLYHFQVNDSTLMQDTILVYVLVVVIHIHLYLPVHSEELTGADHLLLTFEKLHHQWLALDGIDELIRLVKFGIQFAILLEHRISVFAYELVHLSGKVRIDISTYQ